MPLLFLGPVLALVTMVVHGCFRPIALYILLIHVTISILVSSLNLTARPILQYAPPLLKNRPRFCFAFALGVTHVANICPNVAFSWGLSYVSYSYLYYLTVTTLNRHKFFYVGGGSHTKR